MDTICSACEGSGGPAGEPCAPCDGTGLLCPDCGCTGCDGACWEERSIDVLLDRANQLQDEVHRLRGEVERRDATWYRHQERMTEAIDQFTEAKAREQARAMVERVRTITLQPGEYALVEVPDGFTAEAADHLQAVVPDEIRGRLMLVEGRVHTLKPE